ncbi:MAG: WG repeat-containing protein [Muribaculaceae bacterium]|nr:WG repeat-containing protein [Muribaculaceae bacterium]
MKKITVLGQVFAIVVIMGCLLSSCGSKNENVTYIPVQLIDGGAWSFVNEKGERVGTQEWEFEPTVTIADIFTVKTDSGLVVYKWHRDVAKPIDSLKNLVSVGILNEGLLPVTPSMGRIRIVNSNGKLKFTLDPVDGKEITGCSAKFSDGMLVFNTVDGKAGVMDKNGKIVYEPIYSEISDFHDGYALAANYDFENWEAGPTYFILDKKGNSMKVEGKFGYEEGECSTLSRFDHGRASVAGAIDSVATEDGYEQKWFDILTTGEVLPGQSGLITYLQNGSMIINDYNSDGYTQTWLAPDGKEMMKENANYSGDSESRYLYGIEKYVTVSGKNKMAIYDENGELLNELTGAGSLDAQYPGGKFGPIITEHAPDYSTSTYKLLDAKCQPIGDTRFYGVGSKKSLDLYESEEDICRMECVSSAYIDVTAAASKLLSIIKGNVKGKESYWIGQSVKDVLSGENARFYSGSGRDFSVPTDSTGQLASGPGFWVSGMATASADLVAPTYQHYFEVAYYDYYGRAWGYNRQRQVGVHFNSNAKIASFNIVLHTNYPSGLILRQALERRMKAENYTLVKSSSNYDEYSNGYSNVMIYGNGDSRGVGAIIGNNVSTMKEERKAELVTNI